VVSVAPSEIVPEPQPKSVEKSLEEARLSEKEINNLTIEDIRISGLEMTTQQFNKIVQTRIGAKFNQQRLEEDKRSLLQTKQFIDVSISTSWRPDKPESVVVNFDLIPRRMMRYIKIVGNKKLSKREILDELGVKPGETRMDPYEVENGRIRIIEFYKSKDYAEPHVEILRGDRPEDIGVVYLIDEGLKQKVLKTTFVGNKIASSARLKSLISVKPGFMYFIGGNFSRARLDDDVAKLLEYYRKLGFFDARIDREYEEGEGLGGLGKDNAWITVRYIIDEGPRYKIRNFIFEGNRVLSTDKLQAKLKVKPGDYYNYDDIEIDRIALRYEYQDLGYVRADVTPTPLFTEEEGALDLRFAISEDRRYRVRDIIVDYVGPEARTKKSVVWNMLDLSPGELLNGRKIRMSEAALQRSGYFNDKPTEGQLPEISVIPDETRAFTPEPTNTGSVLREARRPNESDDAPASGQTAPSGDPRFGAVEPPLVYRVAYAPVETQTSSPKYVPYEETQRQTSNVSTPLFSSYGPSVAANAPVVRAQTRQIPAAFPNSPTQSQSSTAGQNGGYAPYNSGTSEYSNVDGYANYDGNYAGTAASYANGTAGLDSSPIAPSFTGGSYGEVGAELTKPIAPATSPENDDIYDGDVLVKIQEGRTGMFTASVGVNSDYGLVGNVSFEERNFDLFRLPTRLFSVDGWRDAFRGGGQIFKVQASPGKNVQRYSVSWDHPYI
ncbi:MAG: hypothetical protein HUK22_06235, partial [Thermoguttaceae bacterium]|nr:hypothetical protein [Thermoguttaceae bacterium]